MKKLIIKNIDTKTFEIESTYNEEFKNEIKTLGAKWNRHAWEISFEQMNEANEIIKKH